MWLTVIEEGVSILCRMCGRTLPQAVDVEATKPLHDARGREALLATLMAIEGGGERRQDGIGRVRDVEVCALTPRHGALQERPHKAVNPAIDGAVKWRGLAACTRHIEEEPALFDARGQTLHDKLCRCVVRID